MKAFQSKTQSTQRPGPTLAELAKSPRIRIDGTPCDEAGRALESGILDRQPNGIWSQAVHRATLAAKAAAIFAVIAFGGSSETAAAGDPDPAPACAKWQDCERGDERSTTAIISPKGGGTGGSQRYVLGDGNDLTINIYIKYKGTSVVFTGDRKARGIPEVPAGINYRIFLNWGSQTRALYQLPGGVFTHTKPDLPRVKPRPPSAATAPKPITLTTSVKDIEAQMIAARKAEAAHSQASRGSSGHSTGGAARASSQNVDQSQAGFDSAISSGVYDRAETDDGGFEANQGSPEVRRNADNYAKLNAEERQVVNQVAAAAFNEAVREGKGENEAVMAAGDAGANAAAAALAARSGQ